MKCEACGYEHSYNISREPEIGDEPFICSDMKISYKEAYEPTRVVPIYICPKCGTLKIDI